MKGTADPATSSTQHHLPFPPQPPVRHHGNTYSHAHPTTPGQAPSDRQRYLQYLHSLLHVLLQRHPTLPHRATGQDGEASESSRETNAIRVGRIVRILWRAREWREGELWREGLAWAGLVSGEKGDDISNEGEEGEETQRTGPGSQSKRSRWDSEEDREQADETPPSGKNRGSTSCSSSSPGSPVPSRASSLFLSSHPSDHLGEDAHRDGGDPRNTQSRQVDAAATAERRIDFLRRVAARRRGLRPLMLACKAQELIVLGRWKEALDEIELVLQSPAYRSSPELNLYAGLLVVLLASDEVQPS